MQTFLPYPSFARSAAVLDRQRLGKQRVEALQILRTLRGTSTGWQHHPAVRMWRGYEQALAAYGRAMCDEWTARGYRDTCRAQLVAVGGIIYPPWLDDTFCRAHQANLVRKFPEHYRQFFPDVPGDLPYVWPKETV